MSVANSTTVPTEPWFIPTDILMIVSTSMLMLLAIFFLLIIISDRTCHTVPLLLVGNSCLSALVEGCGMIDLAIFTLQNDLKQIQYEDALCPIRTYVAYASTGLFNNSFLLQALYRYIVTIYPTHLYWQSVTAQLLIISLAWIFAFSNPLIFIFTHEITYDVDDQVCALPLRLSFSILFMSCNAYFIPVSLIVLIYLKLILHVKRMSRRVSPVGRLSRARRELKMVQRLVALVGIQIIVCLPYAVFIFLSFFTSIPKYHFRIVLLCIDVSLPLVMMALFCFTDSLRTSLVKTIQRQINRT